MADQNDILSLVLAEDVKSVDTKQIDAAIDRIIQESSKNYDEIGELALECSAALSSAQSRSSAMASRGFLKRSLDKLTGKDDRLRSAIEKDSVAAQYTLQQMVKGVLNECAQNQKLLMVVKSKFDSELLRLEESQLSIGADVVGVRKALVAVYNNYLLKTAEIETEQQRIRKHAGARCEYCKEALAQDQVVCPHCGTLQELKLERFPMDKQDKLKELARLVRATPDEWDLDIAWSSIAKKYAYSLKKAQQISYNAGVLSSGSKLNQDIEDLINKCRSAEFQIAVVGVLKAGKSMLLNYIFSDIHVGLLSCGMELPTYKYIIPLIAPQDNVVDGQAGLSPAFLYLLNTSYRQRSMSFFRFSFSFGESTGVRLSSTMLFP